MSNTLNTSTNRFLRLLGARGCRSVRCLSTTPRPRAEEVRIVEVGPRDGLQNEKTSIPLKTKIELIRRLAQTGLRDIEAGSFVAPKWVPQVRSLQYRSILPAQRRAARCHWRWILILFPYAKDGQFSRRPESPSRPPSHRPTPHSLQLPDPQPQRPPELPRRSRRFLPAH